MRAIVGVKKSPFWFYGIKPSFVPAIAVIFLAVVTLSGCSSSGTQEKMFNEAEGLLSSGDFSGAYSKYSRLVDVYPSSQFAPKAQLMIGTIKSKHYNDVDGALSAYMMLMKLYPDSKEVVIAHEEVAELLTAISEYRLSIEEYEWLLANGPKERQDVFRYEIARGFMSINDFTQARVELDELLNKIPHTKLVIDAKYLIAMTHYLEGSSKEAIEAFDRLIRGYPYHPRILDFYFAKVTALEELGENKKALSILKELKGEYKDNELIDIRIAALEKKVNAGPKLRKRRR
ncbi:MAG: tetratricopeptide repeat protein [Deltaproteobacteria bacterium]|nr:tetratricopeptide repeat protein [Deltaproteobacteria bacterium]